MAFYYCMGSQVSISKGRWASKQEWVQSMQELDTWENVRYLLEKKMGLHNRATKNGRELSGSFLVGHRFVDEDTSSYFSRQELLPNDAIQHGDCIVLFRKPMKADMGHKAYVPMKYRKQAQEVEEVVGPTEQAHEVKFTDDMTEEQKIALLMQQSSWGGGTPFTGKRKRVAGGPLNIHPSMLPQDLHDDDDTGPIPPPHYICHRCNESGHYIMYCPTLQDKDFIGYNRRQMPHGIPKSSLRMAVTEDERKGAMIDGEGKFWIKKGASK